MTGHRPAIACFEHAVPDKKDQPLEYLFRFQIQKGQVKKAHYILLINYTAGGRKFCFDKTAHGICIQ